MMLGRAMRAAVVLAAVSGALPGPALAQDPELITQPIDAAQRVTLAGNTRPEANAENDRGAVAGDLPIVHMLLLLRRSPVRERALEREIDDLQDRHSPGYHRWLTPAEFGAKFGASTSDLATVTGWLAGQGFRIDGVYPNRVEIDFSGTADAVRAAFHTEIHNLEVDGVAHVANMRDPQIPAALAPAVIGIASLNDFRPAPQYTFAAPCATNSVLAHRCYAVVPADLATIYDLSPLHRSGIVGTGETIVVIEDSNLYATADWSTFRSTFGLAQYPGSLRQIHPGCRNPGVTQSDSEATLDAEWASAAAPGAAIVLASCEGTSATPGLLIAVDNIVNAGKPPEIISISYGSCEAANGAALNRAYALAYQQAVAEGISVFVSAGDAGPAACDRHKHHPPPAKYGLAVNGLASTRWNVAVGGTDFGDTYTGSNALYWQATNGGGYGSARSYVPEIPWNSTCGSALLAGYLTGSPLTDGARGFCNKAEGAPYVRVGAGGGGQSGCATGKAAIPNVVSGSCAGYTKPVWQRGVGNPSDGVRDLPDVALFAAPGVWGHRYVTCFSDPHNQGKPCIGPPSGWAGDGGTSYAAPIMAGIQALVDQHAGGAQGNPDPIYYRLAEAEYRKGGNRACDAARGNKIANDCVFHDVTVGDTDEPCTGSHDCYRPGGTYGVLSKSDSAYRPTFVAGPGWDFATGLGSVDAANLVGNWPK